MWLLSSIPSKEDVYPARVGVSPVLLATTAHPANLASTWTSLRLCAFKCVGTHEGSLWGAMTVTTLMAMAAVKTVK